MKELDKIINDSIKGIGESRGKVLESLQLIPEEQRDVFKGIMKNLDKSLQKKDVNLLNNQMEILQNMLKK